METFTEDTGLSHRTCCGTSSGLYIPPHKAHLTDSLVNRITGRLF